MVSALVLSCGDDGPPERCDPDSVRGIYLVSRTRQNGDCAQIGEHLEVIQGLVYDECRALDGPAWSQNGCKLEQVVVCDSASSPGATVEIVSVSRLERADGSVVTATESVVARDPDGELVCSGTYSVRYVRQ